MKEIIDQRFKDLLITGGELVKSIPLDSKGQPKYWMPEHDLSKFQQWLGSSANLINLVASMNTIFVDECARIMNDQDTKSGIPTRIIKKMHGLLSAVSDEWEHGLLRRIEYIVVAETFDDFLDHAKLYHKGNKKIESSVLASTVLEDTVKKIAKKNSIETKGVSLEPLIDNLVKASVFTPVKAKRIKGYAGVRNHALHAEWSEFDIKDVGELIKGTRELIDEFL